MPAICRIVNMSNYIDLTYVQNRMDNDHLANLSSSSGTIASGVVNAVIDSAEGMFDSYVNNRYDTPVTDNEMVKSHVYNIFARMMHQRRPGKIPQNLEDGYNKTIEFLEKVSMGEMSLNNNRRGVVYDDSRENEGRIFEFVNEDDDNYQEFP